MKILNEIISVIAGMIFIVAMIPLLREFNISWIAILSTIIIFALLIFSLSKMNK